MYVSFWKTKNWILVQDQHLTYIKWKETVVTPNFSSLPTTYSKLFGCGSYVWPHRTLVLEGISIFGPNSSFYVEYAGIPEGWWHQAIGELQ